MKASDNQYPYVTVLESAAPATPPAGCVALFRDVADHVLKIKDAAGTVTAVDAAASATLAGLTDVDLTGLVDGDMIVWDTTTSKWIVAVPGSGGGGGTVTSVTAGDGTITVAGTSAAPTIAATVGTAAGTVAAGNDSRITGAAQKASNLSDLASASTARTNLGLGGAAVLAVGTTTGTVAAGDDSRITGAAPLASPTFTGTPAVPTATGGTNTTQAASTAFVTNAVAKQPEVFMVAVSDESTALTTGTAKVTFRMPFAMTLTSVRASLTTASSSGLPTFNVKESGTTIFSTNLSIDATEKTSTTAATAAVLSDTSLADDAEMTVDITVAGTGATGAKLYFLGTRT